MTVDMKDWISNRADEIALEKYNSEFYSLPASIQFSIWMQAEDDWTDYYASLIDAAYDRHKDNQLLSKSDMG